MDIENIFEMFYVIGDFGLLFDFVNNFIINLVLNVMMIGFILIQCYMQECDFFVIYLYMIYELSDNFIFNVGLCYIKDEGNGDNLYIQFVDYDCNLVLDFIILVFFDVCDVCYDDSEIMGKIGLEYYVDDDVMVYVSFSCGYCSSVFNGGVQFVLNEVGVVDFEFVDVYEVGFKSQLLDGCVQFNVAAFYYDYSD